MSGRRHHYIPQALLRGFSQATGKRLNAWMYRKGAENPTNTNIKNIGLSTDFYAISGDGRVDDAITRVETEYGNVLSRVRSSGTDGLAENDYAILKRFLVHCLIRTARAREIFRTMGESASSLIHGAVGDTQLLGYAASAAMGDEDYLLGLLRSEVEKRGGRFSDDFLRAKIRTQVASVRPNLNAQMKLLAAEATRSVGAAISSKLDGKRMHLSALGKSSPEPSARIAQVENQPFGLMRTNGGPLLLGDGLVVGYSRDGGDAIDCLSPSDELLGWVLPITTEYFVYSGSMGSLDSHGINDASIRFSHQFFLAKERTTELTSRIAEIGTAASVVGRIDWDALYAELARSARDGEIHKKRNNEGNS